jgi:hypothetical protein
MTDAAQWQQVASALRELHRALIERARRDYERERLAVVNPGELLQLLATDPYFEWLRALSELMVDIDMARDLEAELKNDLVSAVRPAVEHLITAPTAGDTHPFAQRYWPYVQDDPHVAMAHAAVKQAVSSWPLPEPNDAATRMHERHRFAEKARHRKR